MKRRTSSQNSGVGGSPSDCDIMASESPDATSASEPSEAGEGCSGKKKSKFQTFKNFFVKKKRKESPPPSGEIVLKGSHSSYDVNNVEPPITPTIINNELGSKINMGNKAVSHDSVFVSDSPSSETNEALGESQDSIHGKVKSIQLQLKHTIGLGSPPGLYGRKGEDAGTLSEDDGLPYSPLEYSSLHNVLATPPQSAELSQRGSTLSMEASDSEDDQMSFEASSRPATPQGFIPVDFSLPASPFSCLDSSAARHRIAVNAKACAKRKPVSRQMLDTKRKDLRERVLLRDKVRLVKRITEEENDYLPEEQGNGIDHEIRELKTLSFASEHEDEEVPDSGQGQKPSPTSSISAGDFSEGEELFPDEDHVNKSEVPESPWENPVTLELQADDFLLDAGCEVAPEEQGSLLEEVLSSLKGPLASGLVLEHENIVLQCEVSDINSGSLVAQIKEEANKHLLDQLEPITTTKEQVPPPDLLSESTTDSEEISEEDLELLDQLLELPEFSQNVSTDEDRQVPEANVEKEAGNAEHAKEEEGKTEFQEELIEKADTSRAFAVNLKERGEDKEEESVVEEKAELERATKVGEDEDEKDDLMVVELERKDKATNVGESQDIRGQMGPLELEKEETSGNKRDSMTIDVEHFATSDQTVRANALNSKGTPDEFEEQPVEVFFSTLSHVLESPIIPSQFSNTTMHTPEKEVEPAPNKQQVASSRPQEVSSEKLEVVSDQQEFPDSPKKQQASTPEGRPQFTIAPAWQRSLVSGIAKEQPQIISQSVPETEATILSSTNDLPPKTEFLKPVNQEESSNPAQTQSSPVLLKQKVMSHVQEEMTPENPFGVRLRRTAALQRYGIDGELPSIPTQTESSEAQAIPDIDQHGKKPILPKKPELLVETVMLAKKIPETVGRISVGETGSPSWISVARQKQRNYIENSLETSPEKLSSQEEVKSQSSLPSLSNSIAKEQLTQPCSTIKVSCSLEISNTSMMEKDSKRLPSPSTAPLSQDEPPWLALAKKKAKAWSEMPQIVQ
ncbi:acrosomal protein KIAA1210-like isoform X2 [Xyrauchen texanus]|uniref:acrosomal protein KIAA1210-like isoform X2 n=1 Tax=Xyrauchen texanus TaxID=154827 RepID=UPI002241AB9A|nr:acrosomal protein KIAA1210-like isoform X2 [Xyrauchen texanus]XP_052010430.1 acrosomal protein KIAA1210-like isoform X2 [Xyrauchen texanus]